MICVLEAIFGPAKGLTFKVRTTGRVDVGRSPTSGASIVNDPHVSRHHAVFEGRQTQDGAAKFRLRDLGSSNGTYVNDLRISTIDLCEGDTVRIGSSVFRVRINEESAAAANVRGGPLVGGEHGDDAVVERVPLRTFTLSPILSDEDVTRSFLTGYWDSGRKENSKWWRELAFIETPFDNVFRTQLKDEVEGLLSLLVDNFDHDFHIKCFVDIEHSDADLRYSIGELMGQKRVKWCTSRRCIVTRDRRPAFRRFLYAARNLSSCIVVGSEAPMDDRWFFRIAEHDAYMEALLDPASSTVIPVEDWPSQADWVLAGNPQKSHWKLLLSPVLELSD